MASDSDRLYHIHLSENDDEVADCIERYGCSPVAHLENLGLLGPNMVAAHCVKVTAEELELLAEREVKVAHCPESNMKLASGVAPVPAMLNCNIMVGVGTDGSASKNDVDLFGEINTAAKIHKVMAMDPTVMDAHTTLRCATVNGASVLGVADETGSLEVGKKADCIVLDMDQPHLTPLYNPVSHLVYAVRGSDVIHSVINGKLVMKDRVLVTLDEEEIVRNAEQLGNVIQHQGNAG
jgi:5-methylthioadenosine/S-adenosylhomocysteine deaminase